MLGLLQKIVDGLELFVGWVFSSAWLPPKDFVLWKWLVVPGFGYGIVLVAIAIAEQFRPAEKRSWARRSLLSGTYLVLAGKLGTYAFLVVPLLRKAWLALDLPSLHLDRVLPGPIYTIVGMLVFTFIGYWAHRLMHRVPVLWHIHKVHHSVTNLNWTSIYHFHFLELLLAAPGHAIASLALGTDLVAPFGIIFLTLDVLGHANVNVNLGRFSYVLSTPQAHRVHHSREPRHYDTNFGTAIMLWDHVFGTFYYDPKDPATVFGVTEDIPTSFWKQQVSPLVWIAQTTRESFRRRFRRKDPATERADAA